MRRTSYTMDGFCLLYLLLILLRSGDVETNPGPNPAVSTVSEMEFLKLAKAIPPSYYHDVGISLGFSYAQLQAILSKKLKNYNNALMDVFMQWNDKHQPSHSKKLQLLVDKLREIDLGGLVDIILNEPLIPNSTEPLKGASSSQPQQTSHRSTEETLENVSGRQEDFDEKLTTVARSVAKHEDIDCLGKVLGFEPEDIQRYVNTNIQTAHVSYMGTLSMLRDWKKKQTKATECEALKDVLEKAGQIRLADVLFDEIKVKPIKMECYERVGVDGGNLQLDTFGIELQIPPGAIDSEAPQDISLRVLTDTPYLGNSKEEMSVCFGVQCLAPHDLVLKLPVTYTIPHCAVITRYSSVEAVLYTGEGEYSPDAEVKEIIPLTQSGIPNCNIKRDILRLQMDHFSWAYIRLKIRNAFFRGKRMCCLPFARNRLPEERTPVILRAHLYDDIKGSKEIVSQERPVGFECIHPETEVLINVAEVDVIMTCFIDGHSIGVATVKYDDIRRGHHRIKSFNLDLRSQTDVEVVVTLQVGQTGQSLEELLCIFKFTTPCRSTSLQTHGLEPLQGASSSQPQQTSHQSTEETLENISGRQEDFDEKLTTVARKIVKHEDIDCLGKALGFEPEDIQRYVNTNMKTAHVSYMGTLSMLQDWKKKQTKATECEAMKGVLEKAGQIHLADELFGTS